MRWRLKLLVALMVLAMPGSAAYDQSQIDQYYVPELNDDFVPPATVPVAAYTDGGFERK